MSTQFKGAGGAAGIAIGRAFCLRAAPETDPSAPEDDSPDAALERFAAAQVAATARLNALAEDQRNSGFEHEAGRTVDDGELDLGAFGTATVEELSDEELEARLLALPGVGPYAAAHVMMTLGRYHRLILDSWTRPTYAKKVGRAKVSDAGIERRFRRYGPYAGLAFWLYLTRDWVD